MASDEINPIAKETSGLQAETPQRLGPYRIDRKIGQGGMGSVYEAWDTRLNRRVALKTVETSRGVTEQIIARFRQEAKHSAKLRHPNVVSVHDIGRDGSFDYFVMDLVDGVGLDQWLKNAKRTIPQRIEIIEKVARALHYAHQQGVIHRDIKPGNILVDAAGEPHVMDFGLALNTKDNQNLTLNGSIVGTPAYMSPEQTMGAAGEIGPATDLWGLGVILYEMMTDKPPFDNGNVYQTIYFILHDEPNPPRKVNPAISKDLETIILKCLEKQASARYEDAERLANDLRAVRQGQVISVRGLTWWDKVLKRLRHHRAISMNEFVIEQQARQRAEAQRIQLQARVENESKQEWYLFFEENFSDPDLESRWEIEGKHWKIENGELRMWAGGPQLLYLRKKIAGDVRIEFECHQDGELLGDMSCFLSCLSLANRKKACDSGYIFQFGGSANTRSFIERPKNRLWQRIESPIVKGVPYRISAERCGPKLTWKVNGCLICEIVDPEPLQGSDRNRVGIYGWLSDTYFRWIRIYALGAPIKSDLLTIAQRQLEKGSFEPAIDIFNEVIESSREDNARLEQARKGIETARLRMNLQAMLPHYIEKIKSIASKAKVGLDEKGVLVDLNRCGVNNLEFLKGIPVSELTCRENQIERLDPLAEISSLVHLDIVSNRVSDLTPLKSLNLQGLRAASNPISDLTPLKDLKLLDLDLSECQVSDLEPLRGKQLVWLAMAGNKIQNLDPLKGCPLKQLNMTRNQVKDLTPLAGMSLSHLYFNYNQVSDLAPLEGMPLTDLSCENNPLKSLQPFVNQPPRVFFFDASLIPPSDLDEAISIWKAKGFTTNAQNAEALLCLKIEDFGRLRKIANPFRGHSYLFIDLNLSFDEACALSEKAGGTLVTLHNEQELEFVRKIRQRTAIWVGIVWDGHQRKWITGEDVSAAEVAILEGPNKQKPPQERRYATLVTDIGYYPVTDQRPFVIKWRL